MFLNTLSVPLRHPWFDQPSTKRKRPASPAESPLRAQKRRRSSTLENGFAGLTLDAPTAAPIVEEPPSPMPRPTTPDAPDVTMKTSSWYELEPDRIVITDLGAFSDEDAEGDASPDALISPAFMERLKRPLALPLPTPPPQSQALVLFRPLPSPISAQTTAHDAAKKDHPHDDAMDVDAMDVDTQTDEKA
ncbi:hypothetical protein DFH06DRAFT_1231548 [Mycena polygramma]|nr:hypothetical protein DFH06DRAFT_1231548 [Mycena polygramma]